MLKSSKSITTDSGTGSTASESRAHYDNGDVLSTLSSDDDSSFYGSQQLRQRYEQKAREIDVDGYWRVNEWNLQVVAARAVEGDPARWPMRVAKEKGKRKRGDDDGHEKHRKTTEGRQGVKKRKVHIKSADSLTTDPSPSIPAKSTALFNPYEGQSSALQLKEPLDSFLTRLKPSNTELHEPWIFCANFRSGERPTDPDIAGFKQVGQRLLDKMLMKRQELEAKFDPPKAEGVITRMMASDRADLESEIMAAAKRHHLTAGKWMLFPTRDKVDRYWDAVVREQSKDALGRQQRWPRDLRNRRTRHR